MDEPRVYLTERSRSEREKQISYTKTYTWNLGKWYWWTYLQGRNRDADVENGLLGTAGGGEDGANCLHLLKRSWLGFSRKDSKIELHTESLVHSALGSNTCKAELGWGWGRTWMQTKCWPHGRLSELWRWVGPWGLSHLGARELELWRSTWTSLGMKGGRRLA